MFEEGSRCLLWHFGQRVHVNSTTGAAYLLLGTRGLLLVLAFVTDRAVLATFLAMGT